MTVKKKKVKKTSSGNKARATKKPQKVTQAKAAKAGKGSQRSKGAKLKSKAPKSARSRAQVTKVAQNRMATLRSTKEALPSKPLSTLNIKPVHDQVFIRLLKDERVTAGGIIIPDTVTEGGSIVKGEVLAVGPGKRDKKGRLRPTEVKVGDVVLFSSWAGQSIEEPQQKYVIVKESDILGVSQ